MKIYMLELRCDGGELEATAFTSYEKAVQYRNKMRRNYGYDYIWEDENLYFYELHPTRPNIVDFFNSCTPNVHA